MKYSDVLKSRERTRRDIDKLYKLRYEDVGFSKSIEIASELEQLKAIYNFKNKLLKTMSKGVK